jgi:hypothetical protein
LVEHFLGKEEVTGSIPVNGSSLRPRMKSFEEFVSESAQQGHVNLLFEQGMYFLAEDLERVLQLFAEAGVPFQVIGGVAVNAH